MAVLLALWALAFLLVTNSYYRLVLTIVPIWAVFGLAWNLLSGYSGLISFGHASFFGLGAYTVALAFAEWHVSPWIGIPAAGLLGCLAGFPPCRPVGRPVEQAFDLFVGTEQAEHGRASTLRNFAELPDRAEHQLADGSAVAAPGIAPAFEIAADDGVRRRSIVASGDNHRVEDLDRRLNPG